MDVSGKVCLTTGGAGGIGSATAVASVTMLVEDEFVTAGTVSIDGGMTMRLV